MKKILMITTGGTIVCEPSQDGLLPTEDSNLLKETMKNMSANCQIDYEGVMNIDSSNMQPEDMRKIAKTIFSHYDKYDGFIVTHGTDTMAYSASMVTYMLQNLNKPVVFTGSQLPLIDPKTDAIFNLLTAVQWAVDGNPGVWIAFYGKIMPAVRAKKMYSKHMDAFHEIALECESPGEYSQSELILRDQFSTKILFISLYPGMNPQILENITAKDYTAVIIEAYGVGNVPSGDRNLAAVLMKLCQKDVAVVISTQCCYNGTFPGVYEVSKELNYEKIIDGGDMTREALTMKVMWALGQYDSLKDVKNCIEKSYCGDRSIR